MHTRKIKGALFSFFPFAELSHFKPVSNIYRYHPFVRYRKCRVLLMRIAQTALQLIFQGVYTVQQCWKLNRPVSNGKSRSCVQPYKLATPSMNARAITKKLTDYNKKMICTQNKYIPEIPCFRNQYVKCLWKWLSQWPWKILYIICMTYTEGELKWYYIKVKVCCIEIAI